MAPPGVQSATQVAGLAHARPYDLRHSFASLLLHEGRSVIYVARQLGHDARLTLTRYGHVIETSSRTGRGLKRKQPSLTPGSPYPPLHPLLSRTSAPERTELTPVVGCRAGRSPIRRPAVAYI